MSDDATLPNPRNLILCFDGTSDEYNTENTNVVKFFSMLKKGNFENQTCYYQAGIGTFFAPGVVSPLFQWCAKILDEAFAWYLDAHVMDGYRFLMENYRDGDKIYLFGFSRGAYTARALAGMLFKVGLLPRGNQEQIPFAYKLYTRKDKAGVSLSAGFKKTYCQNVNIEFIGVWDTVASVGVLATKTLPFTSENSSIKTFRQALSLDEHRVRFKPNLFHREPLHSPEAQAERVKMESKIESSDPESQTPPGPKMNKSLLDYFSRKKKTKISAPKLALNTQTGSGTDVLEVWFAGCHSDIGGGAVSNTTKQSLADITLRWMVHQVIECQCGIQFSETALTALGLPIETVTAVPSTGNNVNSADSNGSQSPPWKTLDALDAVQPLHDALRENIGWWVLEVLPMESQYQDANGVTHTSRIAWPNLGRGRQIYTPKPYFHVTVKERMADPTLAYKPKARWPEGSQVYIE